MDNIPPGRILNRGELIFKEGDKSRSMYLLKSGIIRLFLKKGESNIEIDTIRSGQILGELAFLDGNPRSLSGEALVDCELVEISGPMFMEVLNKAPEWLKILLKTVVGRLRAANTRIRQLEAGNVALSYSDKDGAKRSTAYQYLSYVEFMKAILVLLLVGSRNGKATEHGVDVSLDLIQRYAQTVMGIPISKTSCVIEVLAEAKFVFTQDEKVGPKVYLKNLEIIEELIHFFEEESKLSADARHEVSLKGFQIMQVLVNSIGGLQRDAKGQVTLNAAPLRKPKPGPKEGKDARDLFLNEDLSELLKIEYISDLKIVSADEALVTLNVDHFQKSFRQMQVVSALKKLNEQKRNLPR